MTTQPAHDTQHERTRDLFAAFEWHLHSRHHLELDDVEPTETPGYWRIKEPCGGRAGGCREPLHTFLFNDEPTHHTVSYFDHYRDVRGRWTSPYRTWQAAIHAERRRRLSAATREERRGV